MKVWATIVFIGPEPSQAGVRNPGRDVYAFQFSVNRMLQMMVNYDSDSGLDPVVMNDPVIHISSIHSIIIDHTLMSIM